MKKYTLLKIRNLLSKQGVDPKVLNSLEPSKRDIELRRLDIKRIETQLNEEGLVVLRRTGGGRLEIVNNKFVEIKPRRHFEPGFNKKEKSAPVVEAEKTEGNNVTA